MAAQMTGTTTGPPPARRADAYRRDCAICLEEGLSPDAYPARPLTGACAHAHAQSACLGCVAASIRAQVNSATPCDVACPECRAPLDYDVVEEYADAETMARYRQASLTRLVTQAGGNFTWCPLGCGTGQFHETAAGAGGPSIALCLGCDRQYCHRHLVAWHAEHTCEEYDRTLPLADPRPDPAGGAGPRLDRGAREARERVLEDVVDELDRQVRDAEHRFDVAVLGSRRLGEELELLRRAELERRRRAAEEEEEEAARRRAAAAAAAARVAEERRRRLEAEEAATRAAFAGGTFTRPVKPCPRCKAPIEKISGW